MLFIWRSGDSVREGEGEKWEKGRKEEARRYGGGRGGRRVERRRVERKERRRSGRGNLVQTNEVQSFLHGTPMQSLNRHKHIYQPGMLRKVFTFFTQACSILSSYSLQ